MLVIFVFEPKIVLELIRRRAVSAFVLSVTKRCARKIPVCYAIGPYGAGGGLENLRVL